MQFCFDNKKKLLLGLISIIIIIAICRRITISFDLLLQLINGILSGLQKLLKYFDGTAIFAFFRIGPAWLEVGWASVVPNNLALYLKDLKPLVFSISLFKLIPFPASQFTFGWSSTMSHFFYHEFGMVFFI